MTTEGQELRYLIKRADAFNDLRAFVLTAWDSSEEGARRSSRSSERRSRRRTRRYARTAKICTT
jgi:hypothetical protein